MSRILQDLFEETWRDDYNIRVYPRDMGLSPAEKPNKSVGFWRMLLTRFVGGPDVTKGGR